MSMRYYESPDEPQPAATPAEVPPTDRPNALQTDLATYIQAAEHLMPASWTSEPPEGAVLLDEHHANPLAPAVMLGTTLYQMGYGVTFHSRNLERNSAADQYVDARDEVAVRAIYRALLPPTARLNADVASRLFLVTCTAPSYVPEHVSEEDRQQLNDMAEAFPQFDPEQLLIRARMSSILFRRMSHGAPNENVAQPFDALAAFKRATQNAVTERYEAASVNGYRPFNVEELHGLASLVVTAAFESDPSIPPPADKLQ